MIVQATRKIGRRAGADRTWYIEGYSGIAAREQFDVLVDPAQVFACTDRIFVDGLQ